MKKLYFWWIWWGATIGLISGTYGYIFLGEIWGWLAFSLGLVTGYIFFIQDVYSEDKKKVKK